MSEMYESTTVIPDEYLYCIGNFSCGDKPEANVTVKLYKRSGNDTIGREELNSTTTNENGKFDILGHWNSSNRFDSHISFTHKCHVTDRTRCNRTFVFSFSRNFTNSTEDGAIKFPYKLYVKVDNSSESNTNYGKEKCVNETNNQQTNV
uniref:ZP domain-containing protein n=1 Tax=Strongyloides papillosus TaxID=174720 RepID=A0A0N5BTY6_STREA